MTTSIETETVVDKTLLSAITDFERKGGVIKFQALRIEEGINEYESHMIMARQTLEEAHFADNSYYNLISPRGKRSSSPIYQTNFDILDNSGREISVEHFLGPFFDIKSKKPLIRGEANQDTANKYFYYDDTEDPIYAIDLPNRELTFRKHYKDANKGFVYAFMEPPYGVEIGDTLKERGEYLIHFMQCIFSDINKIKAYSWSIDCSDYFDCGKEWWGAFFWTIYNPEKNWHIGICASSTD